MNIRIQIQSPGFHLNTVLKAEALPEVIELVQKYRVTDRSQLGKPGRLNAKPSADNSAQQSKPVQGPLSQITLEDAPPVLKPRAVNIRSRVANIPVERLLKVSADLTFPEKIVALTGWLQSRDESKMVRPREIKELLVGARLDPPANPGRDFKLAWDQGWVARLQPRAFVLTNEGWSKLADIIN